MALEMTSISRSGSSHYTTATSREMSDEPKFFHFLRAEVQAAVQTLLPYLLSATVATDLEVAGAE